MKGRSPDFVVYIPVILITFDGIHINEIYREANKLLLVCIRRIDKVKMNKILHT